ncbi:hypothetical protein M408DRAFT_99856 [Serendipita vermifera MAFF 305830]|uniref:SHSP domain-containing protein n=1 Tax=Serendipita vermifera MAFF 305830 TaxID=933852 RepID=A0A0C2WUX5_SERVB|nr:hypothetical protein M408DRAFT_99856 [Serendipita vermifera MAFF 305830]
MSLTRALFNEFRPFFRMIEDPFAVDPAFSSISRHQRMNPYNWHSTTPALNLSEENNSYIVEAEVPGVKKENLNLRIGDGGRSLTIEGRVVRDQPTADAEKTGTTKDTNNKQVATASQWSGSRAFTRTVWLPHRIDAKNVSAKLDNGVLTVKATKAKDEAVTVPVE